MTMGSENALSTFMIITTSSISRTPFTGDHRLIKALTVKLKTIRASATVGVRLFNFKSQRIIKAAYLYDD